MERSRYWTPQAAFLLASGILISIVDIAVGAWNLLVFGYFLAIALTESDSGFTALIAALSVVKALNSVLTFVVGGLICLAAVKLKNDGRGALVIAAAIAAVAWPLVQVLFGIVTIACLQSAIWMIPAIFGVVAAVLALAMPSPATARSRPRIA